MTKSLNCILLLVFNLIAFVQNQSFYISPVRITNNCLENELFTNCGSACDPTCENVTSTSDKSSYEPYVVLDEPCKYSCIPGCYCRKPYLRNRFGQCVDEAECRKSLNRNDFVKELNKFLNLNLNDYTTKSPDVQTRNNQQYITVNDNSESIINPRTGYYSNYPKQTGYQSSSTGQNYDNFFGIEKDFFHNLFDDVFSHHLQPKQTRQTDNNYNTHQLRTNGNINVNEDNSLEKMIEKEADIIIQRISNGLKIKRFIIDTLRSLVNRSQYDIGSQASSSNDGKDSKNGLITT